MSSSRLMNSCLPRNACSSFVLCRPIILSRASLWNTISRLLSSCSAVSVGLTKLGKPESRWLADALEDMMSESGASFSVNFLTAGGLLAAGGFREAADWEKMITPSGCLLNNLYKETCICLYFSRSIKHCMLLLRYMKPIPNITMRVKH